MPIGHGDLCWLLLRYSWVYLKILLFLIHGVIFLVLLYQSESVLWLLGCIWYWLLFLNVTCDLVFWLGLGSNLSPWMCLLIRTSSCTWLFSLVLFCLGAVMLASVAFALLALVLGINSLVFGLTLHHLLSSWFLQEVLHLYNCFYFLRIVL